MKSPPRCFGSITIAISGALLIPTAQCADKSGAFDPSSAMHFDAPVVVGTYAFDVERVFGSQTQMVRREATKRQREVAEANARAYMAAQLRAQEAKIPKTKTKEERTKVAIARLPRYVAVDTVKDSRSVPGTKKDVMIWDTHSASLVDNLVYDVSNPPPVGVTAKFDTRPAQYIGNGLLLPEIAEAPPGEIARH